MSAFGRLAQVTLKASAANPLAAGGTAIFGGREALAPVIQSFARDQLGENIESEVHRRRVSLSAQVQLERLHRAMAENQARIAALDPHLYNQLVAGRRLPKGGVRIGGRPDMSKLEALALQMAQGAGQRALSPEQELAQLVS